MNNYECKLVYKGYVQELFYRQGESADAVLKGLLLFQWPKGKWIITNINNFADRD